MGVYIVYWLLRLLSNVSRPRHDQKDKREVILYCGPSNKSVDVVSGKLTLSWKNACQAIAVITYKPNFASFDTIQDVCKTQTNLKLFLQMFFFFLLLQSTCLHLETN